MHKDMYKDIYRNIISNSKNYKQTKCYQQKG